MINMNSQYKKRLRTVKLNDRGQIVIPEDIRKDLDIKDNTTLIIIEKDGELLLKKESEVMAKMENDDRFWKHFSMESMKMAWGKEDEIWDKFYREPGE